MIASKINFALIFYAIFVFGNNLMAQEKWIEPRFRNITSMDGLSQNTVHSLYQDSDGFIWVGTQNGLDRYDGWTFKRFYQNDSNISPILSSIKGNNVYAVTEDAKS